MNIKKAIIILIILGLIGGLVVFAVLSDKPRITYTTVNIEKKDIAQTVSETGTVKAFSKIELSFLNSGKIEKINFKVGDKILKDQIIVGLDCSDLYIKKEEAKANVDVVRTNHGKLLAGAAKEDINISKAGLQQAKTVYEAAEKELEKNKSSVSENIAQTKKTLADLKSSDSSTITAAEQAIINAEIALENIKSAYQSTIDNYIENALIVVEDKLSIANNALDEIDRTINDEDLKNYLSVKNISYLHSTKSAYEDALDLLAAAQSSLETAKSEQNYDNVVKALNDAEKVLDKIFLSLSYCYSALEYTVTSSTLTQSELDIFKINISADQTLTSTAISAAKTAKQNIETALINYETHTANAENTLSQTMAAYDDALKLAENNYSSAKVNGEQQITAAQSRTDSAFEAWQVAQSRYNQVVAPANRHDVSVSLARIKQAEASLAAVKKNIDNCFIKAPVNGTITKIKFEIGEQPGIGSPVVFMLGDNSYEIEVLISEADIAKISKDDFARITLDAFGEDLIFLGKVDFIEPAETVIQDVIYYSITVVFTESKEKNAFLANVKSGMTANVDITTDKRENVLVTPVRAIVDRNGKGKFVRVLIGENIEERNVTLGLRGDGGLVEVLSGLKEGEKVVTYIKEE
ncbi:HlyD family efflux transporter periplasmic adaptor subunit [Candidatus Parcubacteria bacterium]|nr:HlyD family efflux transporter periplasmic adaptor subunit [Candidatus Parcubacteria bacterium]